MSQVKLKIVVPVFNSEMWIGRCIDSILMQEYKNFDCVIINDASTDRTGEVIESSQTLKNDSRFTIIHNDKNVGILQNHVTGYNVLGAKEDPESVLVVVDGDDMLYSYASLALLNQAYTHYNPLMTYGNHIHWPTGGRSNCYPLPEEVIQKNAYRDYKFVSSHLRTFKSKLWYSIKDEDLRKADGSYYSAGCDTAFMWPMHEMARERALFIENVLYIYNRINPLSDDVIRQPEQHDVEMRIRNMPRYERFEE